MTFKIEDEEKTTHLSGFPSSSVTPETTYGSVDLNEFAHLLTDANLSDDQKAEFLGAIWYLITAIVDLGFGADAVQIVVNAIAAEKPPESPCLATEFTGAKGKKRASQTKGDEA